MVWKACVSKVWLKNNVKCLCAARPRLYPFWSPLYKTTIDILKGAWQGPLPLWLEWMMCKQRLKMLNEDLINNFIYLMERYKEGSGMLSLGVPSKSISTKRHELQQGKEKWKLPLLWAWSHSGTGLSRETGISVLGDIQNSTRHGSKRPHLAWKLSHTSKMALVVWGFWTIWSLEIFSSLNYSLSFYLSALLIFYTAFYTTRIFDVF